MNNPCNSKLTNQRIRRTIYASLLVFLLLLVALPAVVQAQFTYTTYNGTITITGYTGPGGAVTIPDTINGLPVTSIGYNAFSGCTRLTNLTIPNSVTSIGDYAFWACNSLTNTTIPNSVTNIGDSAFCECTSLTSITIPNSVTRIGVGTFGDCTRLTNVTIPNSVTCIETNAFEGCTNLSSVTIPNSVTNIVFSAFYGCSSLTSVSIGSGVTSIGDWAFLDCTNLTTLHFGGNAPSLGGVYVFQGDNHATVYYLPGTTGWGATFGGLLTALWQSPPPTAWTLSASTITTTGATLNGTVNPNGYPTTAWFQWGATTNYGNLTSATALGSGTTALPLSAPLDGLTPATTYHFRVAATNIAGVVYGGDRSFTAAWAGGMVTNCTESALRAAMAGGGTVTFACDGTITLASTITNTADTTLDASGHQITISGNGAVRVFYVNSNLDFTLANLTVANGFCDTTGAGIFNGGGTVNATGVAFASNSVLMTNGYAQGGAIRNELGTLNLEGCSFTNNEVWALGPSPVPVALGGAIYNNGTMNARACIFSANSAGALPYPQSGRDRQEGGQAAGGAVYNAGIARFEGSRFDANVAAGGGGGVLDSYCCVPTGVVDGPDGGTGSGGAICNQGWLSVRTSSFMFNQAVGADGGDGFSDRQFYEVPGASGGRGGSGYGGALDNEGTASIASSVFSDNNALGGSGGAGCTGGASQAQAEPGGSGGAGGDASGTAIFNGGSIGLVNCTIALNNGAGGGGGGGGPGSVPRYDAWLYGPGASGGSGGGGGSAYGPIWSASGQVGVTNCTIALNSGQAGSGGPGGAGGPGGPDNMSFPPTNWPSGPDGPVGANGTAIGGGVGVQLLNTLIASDSPSNLFVATDCGHNLSSDASCAFTNTGGMNNTDPQLGPLADNGGPTLTMALLPGSPAIDAGNTSLAPPTDQRGFPRPAGAAADIGAYEYGYVVQAQFFYTTNHGTITIIGYCGPGGAVSIPETLNGLPVTSIGTNAFLCSSLTSVSIPRTVTSIGDSAFEYCTFLSGVYFCGKAPVLGGLSVFDGDRNATVYYLAGTAGWGTTFGGRPTALWWMPPAIQGAPQTQTAEAGSAVSLWVDAIGSYPLFCLWYCNHTNLIICSTNRELELTNVDFSQAGTYTVVISNVLGAVTSAPAMLNVIAPVERRAVPGIKLTGEGGSLLNVDYADSLGPRPSWSTLASVSLASASAYYFDLTLPLPPQRFYRAWQTGTPGVIPSLDLHLVPAITLTGNIGGSVRVDYINRFGPTDAWFTLDTVTLTNTSQLYFDVSAWRQPPRLYRIMRLP